MATWLIVEDVTELSELLLAMFKLWGVDGVAFADGESAVAWIEEVDRGTYRGSLPELALVDLRLPGKIWGDEVAEQLRRSPILKDIAIVFMTGYTLLPQDRERILERTKVKYLIEKPLPALDEFKALLDSALAERRAALEVIPSGSRRTASRSGSTTRKRTPRPRSGSSNLPHS